MSSMNSVYDEEREKILKVGIEVQREWRSLAPSINLADSAGTARKLNEWTKRVQGAYEKIGFRVEVDVNPIYGDHPPGITVLDRINSIGEFDHDRLAWEIRKQ